MPVVYIIAYIWLPFRLQKNGNWPVNSQFTTYFIQKTNHINIDFILHSLLYYFSYLKLIFKFIFFPISKFIFSPNFIFRWFKTPLWSWKTAHGTSNNSCLRKQTPILPILYYIFLYFLVIYVYVLQSMVFEDDFE